MKRGAWLGQVPLILGPSSWGAGGIPVLTAPFYGEWGVVKGGEVVERGRVGPYQTVDEAFRMAAKEAVAHGATRLPIDGYAQAVDSTGRPVGPVT